MALNLRVTDWSSSGIMAFKLGAITAGMLWELPVPDATAAVPVGVLRESKLSVGMLKVGDNQESVA